MDLKKAKKVLSGTLLFGDEEQIAAHKYWEEVEECIAAIKSCPHGAFELCEECDGHGKCFHCERDCDECDGDGFMRHDDCECFDKFLYEGTIRDAFTEFEIRERKKGLR